MSIESLSKYTILFFYLLWTKHYMYLMYEYVNTEE